MTKFGKSVTFITVILLAGVGFLFFETRNPPTGEPLVTSFEECAEAGYPVMESYPRQCRDTAGHLFVETIPNPNPAPDPTPSPTPAPIGSGYVSGHVSIGPNCPGPEREGYPCPVPPGAYSSREVFVYQSDEITIKVKGKIDAEGDYKIAISPGNYFIQISPAGIGPGEKKPVTIKANQTTVVDFDIDTGIR